MNNDRGRSLALMQHRLERDTLEHWTIRGVCIEKSNRQHQQTYPPIFRGICLLIFDIVYEWWRRWRVAFGGIEVDWW